MSKKAILLGASGLIGHNLLEKLLVNDNYSEVLSISRKTIDLKHHKLQQLIIDFDTISHYTDQINGDEVFCCLGSTIKKTPDLSLYRKIDYQYPLDVARIAFTNGAKQYHLVSAMGANTNSKLFYSRTKGEIERDLQQIHFQSIHIYRPSLLDGDRKEERKTENTMITLMRAINPFLIGPLKKYRSIKIEKVALAMLNKAKTNESGIHIYTSDQIQEIADR